MPKYKIFSLVMALAVTSALARSAQKPDEISFSLAQGFGIVLRGQIGYTNNLNFLLDTGAVPSVEKEVEIVRIADYTNNLNFLLDTGAVPSVLGQRAASQMGIRGALGSMTLLDQE